MKPGDKFLTMATRNYFGYIGFKYLEAENNNQDFPVFKGINKIKMTVWQ